MSDLKIRSRDLLTTIKKEGRRFNSSFFSLIVLNNNLSLPIKEDKRYFIVISKKISKKAVVRNLLKRRIKYIIRQNNLKDIFLIIFVKKGIEELSFPELNNNLISVFKQSKILK